MAKKLKVKLPKRIAGVKIPKSIRKGPVGQFLNSGAGQIIIADALAAAVGAIAVSKGDENSGVGELVRHPVDGARRIGQLAKRSGADHAARLPYALKEAGRAFRAAMDEGENAEEDSPQAERGQAAATAAETEPVSKKKPPPRGESGAPH